MSGHSKWSTIKRQKGANDAKRGQIFTKLSNAITVAVREGGGPDATANFKLRLAIEKARAYNMPKDNVDRAIDRATGKGGADQLASTTYEGFGPLGTAVIVQAVTDNKNRTTSDIKTAFDRGGGTMGQPGSVAWQFDQVGDITVPISNHDEDAVYLAAVDAGAEDVEIVDNGAEIFTKPEEIHSVKEALEAQGYTVEGAEQILRPKQTIAIKSQEEADKIMAFIDRLEVLDDVTDVSTNADIPPEFLS